MTQWTGTTSTNWNDASNWDSGAPTSSSNVIIPGGTAYQPILSQTATIGSLVVNSGGTLSLQNTSSGHALNVGSSGVTVNGGGMIAVYKNKLTTTGQIIDNGTITLASGTLTATNGITVGGPGMVEGFGTVSSAISGAGVVEASGGTLILSQSITDSGLKFVVDNSASSLMEFSGSVASGNTVTFAGTLGGVELNDVTATPDGLNFSSTLNDFSTTAGTFSTSSDNYIDLHIGTIGTIVVTGAGSASASLTIYDTAGDNLGRISLTNIQGSWQYADWTAVGNGSNAHEEIWLSDTVCFAAGTRIATPAGERAVETLAAGDSVTVLAGGERRERTIGWVGHRRLDLAAHPHPEFAAPVCVEKDAFAEGVPHADVWLSPDHAVFVDGWLIAARQLVNGTTIRQAIGLPAVEYWHVELEEHAVLLAEGLPAESYLDTGNRDWFDNSGEPMLLHPMMDPEAGAERRAARSCAPFATGEAVVKPVWERLAARAKAMGRARAGETAATGEADLRLLVRGREVKPLYAEGDLYLFVLRAHDRKVRLRSRSLMPAACWPWLDDRRQLGVGIGRIVLRGAAEVRALALDGAGFGAGWWESEAHAACRWTDGDAALTLPAMPGPCVLEVTIAATLPYPLAENSGTKAA